MKDTMRLCGALVLLLAGCGGAGDWARPDADEGAATAAYQDCRALAGDAVRTDADIDQDILATRQGDWQRAGVVRQQTQIMHEQTRDRAASLIDSCMKAKGYSQKR
jgi:hypothetical protein